MSKEKLLPETGEDIHAYKDDEHKQEDDLEHTCLHISEVKLTPKISIKDLHRYTDSGDLILSEISLDISAGSVLGIIGPSGSGKSTLLRAINRLWEPPPASVFLDGKDITMLDVISVRRRVGMLFQLPALFDGTVADNLNYGPSLKKEKLSLEQMEELLKYADLDAAFLSKSVVGLSVGQSQRVALARTLANNPEVLLLDEPTSALDPVSAQNIEESILDLKMQRGLTIVLVSHSLKQVQRIADLVCVLVNGNIVEITSPSNLQHSTHPMVQKLLDAS
ncbi:hypothetical protein KP509_12G018400 [Ceratopteris richardii]|uniref:ABC transporter domain-containing protein n=1 Tax=Ceratopteris richardii TaxID=49495 RepID=A0A8T2TJ33_CERRI|nr:hypothetical protein KP509_12G018400 [Ceratopteris richardii]KAH7422640.1 hypothetical protein KP509_12G018400 [Ceratopteris richardii]KAH7422641.1 hypothetical protein KP509_12G018400 [Ceratopteris richardii]KAH7422642.1 hypothetical protein KP509_12G018400 [Ceratopteris richardii]